MKGLTLTEPWASLMAIGAKRIETRGWAPRGYFGPVAIHSAKKWDGDERLALDLDLHVLDPNHRLHGTPDYPISRQARLLYESGYRSADELPRGHIVAVGELSAVYSTDIVVGWHWPMPDFPTYERDLGDYSPGRWAWVFTGLKRLATPVPCRGAMGLWPVPADVVTWITGQL